MSGALILEVSIGPVQGFVGQSRRTRDLWGSSYLLSYLSARAALGVSRAGAEIVRPVLEERDPLYEWVRAWAEGRADGPPPDVGSVPNHFAASVESVEAGRRAAEAGIAEMQQAWKHICQVVWDTYVADAAQLGVGVADIWRRQTEQFWEVMWTMAPEGEAGAALARRKLWRTHCLPDEPGDKCMVMPDLQELSGYVRARGEREAEAQDRFWAEVRKKAGPLNLPVGDRLCAVALVKRLFADVSEEAIGGRIEVSNWPSTVYIAAVPWIKRVREVAPQQAAEYARAVARVAPKGVFAERRAIVWADSDREPAGDMGGFEKLDGNFYHARAVQDEQLCPLSIADPHEDARIRQELADKLRAIAKASGPDHKPVGFPSIYYALLLADGDSLRELLRVGGARRVSEALNRFTAQVPGIVESRSGVTVYAGGDDVLAMLPVPAALDCARELAAAYRASWDMGPDLLHPAPQSSPAPGGSAGGVEPTLSAAVLFAHARVPLSTALSEVRRLLDDVAKEGNNRNSLAVGILKRGGMNAEWVTTWRRSRFGGAGLIDAVDAVQNLAARLGRDAEGRISASLLYRLRSSLGLLCGWPDWAPGAWGRLLEEVDLSAFVRAEVLSSLEHRPSNAQGEQGGEVEELVQAILDLLGRSRNDRPGAAPGGDDTLAVGVDGLMIARFHATRGEEGEDE